LRKILISAGTAFCGFGASLLVCVKQKTNYLTTIKIQTFCYQYVIQHELLEQNEIQRFEFLNLMIFSLFSAFKNTEKGKTYLQVKLNCFGLIIV